MTESIYSLYYNQVVRIMAIDYGEKRVGIASTDESGRFALPRFVLPNNEELLSKILAFKIKEGIERIVIGESRNFKGEPNPIQKEILDFKKALEDKGVEVALHPEIFTTQEAIRLQGASDLTDASAAALILKNYLDTMYNKEP